MILVDTSVWVDHLRAGERTLVDLLESGMVLAHPFVVGELALGGMRNRRQILTLLNALPPAAVATHGETMHFIESQALHGRGIGYVDAHLLAGTRLHGDARLWTRDKRLHEVATTLGIAMQEPPRSARAPQRRHMRRAKALATVKAPRLTVRPGY